MLRWSLLLGSLIASTAGASAQLPEVRPDDVLGHMHSPQLVSDQAGLVVIRGTRLDSGGASSAAEIKCWRGALSGDDMVAEIDLRLRTDDRVGAPAGFCDALVQALARQGAPRR